MPELQTKVRKTIDTTAIHDETKRESPRGSGHLSPVCPDERESAGLMHDSGETTPDEMSKINTPQADSKY